MNAEVRIRHPVSLILSRISENVGDAVSPLLLRLTADPSPLDRDLSRRSRVKRNTITFRRSALSGHCRPGVLCVLQHPFSYCGRA